MIGRDGFGAEITSGKPQRLVKGMRILRSASLSFLCVLALLGTLFVTGKQQAPEKITIRTVNVGLPPPPPPPPSSVEATRQTTTTQMNLLNSIDQGIALAVARVEPLDLQPPALPPLDIRASMPALESVLSFDWSGFGLSELDQAPRLLTTPRVRFPENLRSRGVNRALVELNVMIDEGGRVFLREIVKNPHPQLSSEIRLLAQRARFTPPKKGGRSVRAVFIWPVEFTDE